MLLPFLPRDERERGACSESIGPVWDGNEVWLVVAGGGDLRRLPRLVRDDVLGLLPRAAARALLPDRPRPLVRVAREGEEPALADVWMWANALGSFGASLVWGVGLSALLYGLPIDSSGDFAGDFFDLFSGYTVLGGISVVLLFAFHGATYLTIRTTGDLCERALRRAARCARRRARRRRLPRSGPSPSPSTGTTRRLPAGPARALGDRRARRSPSLSRRRRSGWAFALTAVGDGAAGRDAVHEPLSAGHGLEHGFREQPDGRQASSAHYTLAVMSVVAADLPPDHPPLPGLDVPRLPRTARPGERGRDPVELLARKTDA